MPEKKNIKAMRSIREYCSRKAVKELKEAGSKVNSILEPSSGGMGTRLKTAKAIFMITIVETIK